MPPPFPLDVWGVVVECLQLEEAADRATFQAASLICSEFRDTFQELLFRQFSLTIITFGTAITEDRLRGLTRTPRLLSYVREFKVAIAPSSTQAGTNRKGWFTKNGDLLAYFLEVLPIHQLEALSILDLEQICSAPPAAAQQLHTSSHRLRQALRKLQQGHCIQRLHMGGFAQADFVGCSPALKSLALQNVQHTGSQISLTQQPSEAPAMLETLESHDVTSRWARVPSIYHHLLQPNGPISLRRLRRLVWKYEEDTDEVYRILKECQGSLEHLELHLHLFILAAPISPGLFIDLKRLKHLFIWEDNGRFPTHFKDAVTWTCAHLMQQVRPLGVLEIISIKVISANPDTDNPAIEALIGPWNQLCTVVEDEGIYPSLRSVTFQHQIIPDRDGMKRIGREELEEFYDALSEMRKGGIFHVELN